MKRIFYQLNLNIMMTISTDDHVRGAKNASVELIEYADYECPYCKKSYYVIKEIQQAMGDNLKLIFRNFPIPQLHQHAIHAAIAAEIAASHGKFWEMHDMLFENQHQLDDSSLMKYAAEIGIDLTTFEDEFKKDEFFQKVNKDYQTGIKSGVEGTPALFVNGEFYEGDWRSSEFLEYLKSKVR